MSGWNIPYLSELVLGLFMVAVGAMLLADLVGIIVSILLCYLFFG